MIPRIKNNFAVIHSKNQFEPFQYGAGSNRKVNVYHIRIVFSLSFQELIEIGDTSIENFQDALETMYLCNELSVNHGVHPTWEPFLKAIIDLPEGHLISTPRKEQVLKFLEDFLRIKATVEVMIEEKIGELLKEDKQLIWTERIPWTTIEEKSTGKVYFRRRMAITILPPRERVPSREMSKAGKVLL